MICLMWTWRAVVALRSRERRPLDLTYQRVPPHSYITGPLPFVVQWNKASVGFETDDIHMVTSYVILRGRG